MSNERPAITEQQLEAAHKAHDAFFDAIGNSGLSIEQVMKILCGMTAEVAIKSIANAFDERGDELSKSGMTAEAATDQLRELVEILTNSAFERFTVAYAEYAKAKNSDKDGPVDPPTETQFSA